jgi:hypothetical protein
MKLGENEKPYLKHCKQGESLRVTWERYNPPETWKRGGMRGGVKGRPQFMKWRLREECTYTSYSRRILYSPYRR